MVLDTKQLFDPRKICLLDAKICLHSPDGSLDEKIAEAAEWKAAHVHNLVLSVDRLHAYPTIFGIWYAETFVCRN